MLAKPLRQTVGGYKLCDSFIRDGMVLFLPDCSHELAGKTVDLLEVE